MFTFIQIRSEITLLKFEKINEILILIENCTYSRRFSHKIFLQVLLTYSW